MKSLFKILLLSFTTVTLFAGCDFWDKSNVLRVYNNTAGIAMVSFRAERDTLYPFDSLQVDKFPSGEYDFDITFAIIGFDSLVMDDSEISNAGSFPKGTERSIWFDGFISSDSAGTQIYEVLTTVSEKVK